MSNDDEVGVAGMFEEPPDYFRPDPETSSAVFERAPDAAEQYAGPRSLQLQLVAKHSLWAHMLWNAGKLLANFIDSKRLDCSGKQVLELGAGAAVPSMIAAIHGAHKVVVTDYPEERLIRNIQLNFERNLPHALHSRQVVVKGHLWGSTCDDLLAELDFATAGAVPAGTSNDGNRSEEDSAQGGGGGGRRRMFDVVLLADLVFNHSQHRQLLTTCARVVSPGDGKVAVTLSHHRPDKAHLDMQFFEMAAVEFGFRVEHVCSVHVGPMFEHDQGPEEVRAMVHMYLMHR